MKRLNLSVPICARARLVAARACGVLRAMQTRPAAGLVSACQGALTSPTSRSRFIGCMRPAGSARLIWKRVRDQRIDLGEEWSHQ